MLSEANRSEISLQSCAETALRRTHRGRPAEAHTPRFESPVTLQLGPPSRYSARWLERGVEEVQLHGGDGGARVEGPGDGLRVVDREDGGRPARKSSGWRNEWKHSCRSCSHSRSMANEMRGQELGVGRQAQVERLRVGECWLRGAEDGYQEASERCRMSCK